MRIVELSGVPISQLSVHHVIDYRHTPPPPPNEAELKHLRSRASKRARSRNFTGEHRITAEEVAARKAYMQEWHQRMQEGL